MKKICKLLPVLVIMLFLASCGEKEVTYRTFGQIKESGIINIAYSTDQYDFLNNDINVEENELAKKSNETYLQEEKIIGKFLESTGLKANIIKSTREEAVNHILAGTADIALGKIEITESDKFKVNYGLKYAEEEPYIITNKGVNVNLYSELGNKKIAVMANDPISAKIKESLPAAFTETKEYKNFDTAIEQLKLYNTDAVICYKEKAIKALEANPDVLQINTLADSKKIEYAGMVAK